MEELGELHVEEPGRTDPRPVGQQAMAPAPMDVYERDGAVVVKVDLPGVRKEDVHLSLDHGRLVVQGRRRDDEEVGDEEYYRRERHREGFYRALPLPYDVRPDQVQATFRDGVLRVQLARPAEEPAAVQAIAIG